MTLVQQADAGGDCLTLLKLNNFLYPPFSADVIKGISSLDMREDDVIICAYPKAGTHWVWEITRYLQAQTTNVPNMEKDSCMIEWVPGSRLDQLPSPRTLNTHLMYHQLPSDVFRKRCKIVYVNRNPKDLAVSCYHHHRKLSKFYQYKGSWENFFPLFLDGQLDYGSWFDYVRDWERVVTASQSAPIHDVTYEDIKENPVAEILSLAKFLNKQVDQSTALHIAEKCSFPNMKSRKGQLETCSNGEPIMYRKGEVGDWVNWFTVQQNEAMDAYYRQLMRGSKLTFKYRPDVTPRTNDVITDSNMNMT